MACPPIQPHRPRRPDHRLGSAPAAAPRPAVTPACERRRRNQLLLAAYARRRDPRLRQELIALNLPLVRQQALRLAPRTDLELDDLIQIGCLGLIRAVEAFDPARRSALSSFAVPYVKGAMLHYLRDVHGHLRPPRRLRELQQQAEALQQRRQHSGLAPLPLPALAAELAVEPRRLQEALALRSVLRLQRLDAPIGGSEEEEGGATLLDQLAAPAAAHSTAAAAGAGGEDPRLRWLRQRLAALDPLPRRLLEGRWLEQRPWAELAAELGIQPRLAQRRLQALLQELQSEAQRRFAAAPEAAL